jgi:hypothetical protein
MVLWAIFIEKEYWSSVAIVLTSLIVFSPITYEYRASFLLVPLYLFAKSKERMKFRRTLAILFGLALSPLHFWGLNEEGLGSGAAIAPFVFTSLLIFLLLDSIVRNKSKIFSFNIRNRP